MTITLMVAPCVNCHHKVRYLLEETSIPHPKSVLCLTCNEDQKKWAEEGGEN